MVAARSHNILFCLVKKYNRTKLTVANKLVAIMTQQVLYFSSALPAAGTKNVYNPLISTALRGGGGTRPIAVHTFSQPDCPCFYLFI